MSRRYTLRVILGQTLRLLPLILLTGCTDSVLLKSSEAVDIDSESDSSSDSETVIDVEEAYDTESECFETEPGTRHNTAIAVGFDDWDPSSVNDRVYVSKPEMGSFVYEDSNTIRVIDGHACLAVHEDIVSSAGYGGAVEVQLPLNQRTDMSREDFSIRFDVFIPEETFQKDPIIQFAFYETEFFTPIYSIWYQDILAPNEWITVSSPIDMPSQSIDYSGFENDPQDWIFDVVRIQLLLVDDDAMGEEILFYLDNLMVERHL